MTCFCRPSDRDTCMDADCRHTGRTPPNDEDEYRATDAPLRRAVTRRLAEIARDVGRLAAETRAEGLGGVFVQNWPLSVDVAVAPKIRG